LARKLLEQPDGPIYIPGDYAMHAAEWFSDWEDGIKLGSPDSLII
jgi:hypothetical protein